MKFDPSKIKKILVLRPDMIGDVLLITPALSALRKKFPRARITLLIQSYSKDAVKNNPDIDELIEVPAREFGSVKNFFRLLKTIEEKNFDLGINYYNEFSYAFLLFAAGIPCRLGDRSKILIGWMYNLKIFQHWRDYTRHEVEQNLELLLPLGIDEKELPMTIKVSPDAKTSVLKKISSSRPLIVMHLGTGGGNKPYLPENFAKAADLLKEQLSAQVVLTGAKREAEKAEKVLRRSRSKPVNLVEKTTLQELIALIDQADLFIGVDSGPLHIASALQKRIVAIFPSKEVKPTKWGPWKTAHIILHNPYQCDLTCYVRRCPFNICALAIKPEEIVSAADRLLNQPIAESREDWYKKSLNILLLSKDSQESGNYLYELKKNGYHAKRLNYVPSLRALLKLYGNEDINIVHQLNDFGWLGNFKIYLSKFLSSLIIPIPILLVKGKPAANNLDALISYYLAEFRKAKL